MKPKRKKDQERSSNRRSQIGSGDRSERIRTYNFPQGRLQIIELILLYTNWKNF